MLRLYTFCISHFSEKVRWAFDYEGIEYVERRVPPGPHIPIIRRHAPKQTVPMLLDVRDDKKQDTVCVQGSSAILDYMQNTLGATKLVQPTDALTLASAKLEALADHAIGLGVQRIVYEELLKDRSTLIGLWAQGGPSWGPAFYTVAYPFMTRALRRMYTITPEAVGSAKETFRRAFTQLDELLEKHRFLLGDEGPSRADITVASLLAPLCMPPEHVVEWPKPTAMQIEIASEFKGRPTWDFVLRMYREHRKPS